MPPVFSDAVTRFAAFETFLDRKELPGVRWLGDNLDARLAECAAEGGMEQEYINRAFEAGGDERKAVGRKLLTSVETALEREWRQPPALATLLAIAVKLIFDRLIQRATYGESGAVRRVGDRYSRYLLDLVKESPNSDSGFERAIEELRQDTFFIPPRDAVEEETVESFRQSPKRERIQEFAGIGEQYEMEFLRALSRIRRKSVERHIDDVKSVLTISSRREMARELSFLEEGGKKHNEKCDRLIEEGTEAECVGHLRALCKTAMEHIDEGRMYVFKGEKKLLDALAELAQRCDSAKLGPEEIACLRKDGVKLFREYDRVVEPGSNLTTGRTE